MTNDLHRELKAQGVTATHLQRFAAELKPELAAELPHGQDVNEMLLGALQKLYALGRRNDGSIPMRDWLAAAEALLSERDIPLTKRTIQTLDEWDGRTK